MTTNNGCQVCNVLHDKSVLKIYEDESTVALLDENPATPGQVVVMPKEHFTIMEQVPDYVLDHIFQVVNKLSVVLFESLHVEGTNILLQNGVAAGQGLPHFMVNLIPRKEGDGLNLLWQPKQLSEEEMSTVELVLKEQAETIGNFQTKKEEDEIIEEEHEEIEHHSTTEQAHHAPAHHTNDEAHGAEHSVEEHPKESKQEENYLIKHLTRIA